MLRNRGVLSKADYRAIMTEIDVPLTNKDKKYMEEKFKIPQELSECLRMKTRGI